MKFALCLATLLALVPLMAAAPRSAEAAVNFDAAPQARVIVSLKPGATTLRETAMSLGHSASTLTALAKRRADVLARHAGRALSSGRMVGERAQVLMASGVDSATLARRLAQHPDVEYAVVDHRRRAARVPTDPLYASGPANGRGPDVGQWYLRAPAGAVVSAINAEAAWEMVNVDTTLVVAVLDTGTLGDHPDLAGHVLAGYDMISYADVANDGNARDSNASDPGDWITTTENTTRTGLFYQCGAQDSSWHGTQTAGLIGAGIDNGVGIVGVAAGVRILPVRVLGKCGGYDSDIIAGMYWAAGINQPGLPRNRNAARVLNMSLGSSGSCDAAYAQAVSEITARGAVIVAAAGNSAGHAVGVPGNCAGVVAVSALRHVGSKVGFSDLGPEITISAPGGNCVNIGVGQPCLYPMVSTTNTGLRGPVAGGSTWTDSYDYAVGTSFSAPLVAGTVALMLSARPELTPAQVIAALKRSARPFAIRGADNGSDPTPVPVCRPPNGIDQEQCYCTTALCGAGMLDAAAAVQAVLEPESDAEKAYQLLNLGERSYSNFFPDRPATQTAGPFVYRFHPSTGTYLGVVVDASSGYVLGGVYVQGGAFGNTPVYVGRVNDFLAPAAAASAAKASRR
jgi:serine protease